MNKDALLATAIGFFIGLCITGILLVGPTVFAKLPKITITLPQLPKAKQTIKGKPPQNPLPVAFSISSPLNEAIESNNELLLSGNAPAKSVIIISGNTQDTALIATEDNTFAGKIVLTEGKNDLSVTSYSQGAPTTQSLVVYYTPEVL